ncbi:MAG: FAD-dependent oxidoreductase [Actinomycetes bacterium]
MNTNPDAIVIGAGIVGATTALSLTNAGMKVLVIDRGNVATGTTSAGEGNILVSDKAPGPELDLALRSRDAWFEIQEDIGGGFELEAKGGLVVARSEDGLRALRTLTAAQRIAGIDAQDISVTELRVLEPHLSHSITDGAFYPQDAQCQPMLAAAHILRAVRARGGEFVSRANVTAINSRSGSVTGVVTSKGTFNSPIIVNATGTWAGQIAQLAGSALPIAPRRGFILVSAPTRKIIFHKVYDAEYVANVSSGDVDLQSSAVVEGTQSGTILIGASRERVGFQDGIDFEILRILARQAIALFPILADIQLLRAYRGFRPYAPDHLPVIGEDPIFKGFWHNAGHEGAGIGLAPASAQLICDGIFDRPSFMDPTPFAPARFAKAAAS